MGKWFILISFVVSLDYDGISGEDIFFKLQMTTVPPFTSEEKHSSLPTTHSTFTQEASTSVQPYTTKYGTITAGALDCCPTFIWQTSNISWTRCSNGFETIQFCFGTKEKSYGYQAEVWFNTNLIRLPFNKLSTFFSAFKKVADLFKRTQNSFNKFVERKVGQSLRVWIGVLQPQLSGKF